MIKFIREVSKYKKYTKMDASELMVNIAPVFMSTEEDGGWESNSRKKKTIFGKLFTILFEDLGSKRMRRSKMFDRITTTKNRDGEGIRESSKKLVATGWKLIDGKMQQLKDAILPGVDNGRKVDSDRAGLLVNEDSNPE